MNKAWIAAGATVAAALVGAIFTPVGEKIVELVLPQAPSAPDIEVVDVTAHYVEHDGWGFSATTYLQIVLKNKGTAPGTLSRIRLRVNRIHEFTYDPCALCSRVEASAPYQTSLAGMKAGDERDLSVVHSLAPREVERIGIIIGGDAEAGSYVAELELSVVTDDTTITSPPVSAGAKVGH